MASADIEVNWLTSEILPKLLKDQKLIADIGPSDWDKFHVRDVAVDFIGSQEAFMLTTCYRASVTYEFKGEVDTVHLFVKKTPHLPQEIFDVINFKALFTNEILGYDKIMPTLEKFGKLKLNLAKFYYAKVQSSQATVITDNFISQGWRMTKDKVNLSLDHALVAMKYLANFHAAGMALRNTDPTSFVEVTQNIQESRYASDEIHHRWSLQMKTGIKRTLKAVRDYQKDIPEEFLQKYAKLEETFHLYSKQLVQPVEPLVTLCHGDYLRNNVAYKYDDGDECAPKDIMMFDLQTLRVSSPMFDVITFMSLSLFAEVRHAHFQQIFQVYCNQLRTSYEAIAQQPVPEYLSYDCLLKDYIRFMPYGILTAAVFLAILWVPCQLSTEEMLLRQQSEKEIEQNAMFDGGELLNRELAHQMKEMYDLSRECDVRVL